MKILQKWAATVAIPLALTGCAGTELHQEAVTSNDLHEARRQMDSAPLPAEKGTAGYEQHTMVKRVEERIRPATQKVCKRTLEAETCQTQYAKIKVSVKPEDETINAYADVNGNVVFYGGLVRRAGSDDEIAGVMGHEMAHVLLRHNEKSSTNQAVGLVVGGLISAVVVGSMGPCYTAQCSQAQSDLLETGMAAGAAAGAVTYSPEMELEADQLGAYIVKEAGYDVAKARNFFIRMARTDRQAAARGHKGAVGYMLTHPADDARIAHWNNTMQRIREGRKAPETKQAIAARAAALKERDRCENLYAEYPDCPYWGRQGWTNQTKRWGLVVKGVCPALPGECPGP